MNKIYQIQLILFFLLVTMIGVISCNGQNQPTDENYSREGFIDSLKVFYQEDQDYFINPVIPGFNPDPCIIRVKDDYYIATSSFEWLPGIPIYHSKDLVNWELISHVLTKESQVDLRGTTNSGGIMAPGLSWHNGVFYVLYTIFEGTFPFNASPNYVVTSNNIAGPWSDPVYLNSTGFDPDLFFDDDGKCYLLNMKLDFYSSIVTGGIILQEFDQEQKILIGKSRVIFKGTEFGTEGPHIYKKDGYYYLITAEGGTDWNHQVTLVRSENIWGPYEVSPNNPLLTAKDAYYWPLQRAGHSSFVNTQNNDWYIAYLASRPVMPQRLSVLGRETCIQKLIWEKNKWPKLESEGPLPSVKVKKPALPVHTIAKEPFRDDFDGERLRKSYMTLRHQADNSWVSLSKRKGYLSLRGRTAFNNRNDQSLIVRRVTSHFAKVETSVDFEPDNYRQMAGLICFYDTDDFIYLKVSFDKKSGRNLSITCQTKELNSEPYEKIQIPEDAKIYLRLIIQYDKVQFYYSFNDLDWEKYGSPFDFSKLSDENGRYGFTGSTVGICVQDMEYESKYAYFDYFEYRDFNPFAEPY